MHIANAYAFDLHIANAYVRVFTDCLSAADLFNWFELLYIAFG